MTDLSQEFAAQPQDLPREALFLEKIQEYISHRVIWMVRDLNRAEGVNEQEVARIRTTVKEVVGDALGEALWGDAPDQEGSYKKLRGHVTKMTGTLEDNHRFSSENNPTDRRFVIDAIRIVLNRLGIQGVHVDIKTGRRELRTVR